MLWWLSLTISEHVSRNWPLLQRYGPILTHYGMCVWGCVCGGVCVCACVCITGLELHHCCPDFLLSFFPPWSSISWQQAVTQHLLAFVSTLSYVSCLFSFCGFFFFLLCPSHHSSDPLQAACPCESIHCPWDAILPACILLCKCLSLSNSDIYRAHKMCLLQLSASRHQSVCPSLPLTAGTESSAWASVNEKAVSRDRPL